MSAVVSTWKFTIAGVVAASDALQNNSSALDAVERGISVVEHDESVTSVGFGGLPNAAGALQLDAALVASDGRAGAVMAVEGFPAAIPLARLVLEHCRHTALAADGAVLFARQHGLLPREDASSLLSAHARRRYAQFRAGLIAARAHQDGPAGMRHTDTVGMIARDAAGLLVVGCATSGMQFKAVGRVGDSPIIGAGLYADEAGAAAASGDGDTMMRFCITFLVVERMRGGDSPSAACRFAVARVHASQPACQAGVVAMSRDGTIGSGCTHRGFHVVHWNSKMTRGVETFEADGVAAHKWEHTCT